MMCGMCATNSNGNFCVAKMFILEINQDTSVHDVIQVIPPADENNSEVECSVIRL